MENEIEKPGCRSMELSAAIDMAASLADPNLVNSLYQQYGWNLNTEVRELIAAARQNLNLPAKLKAIKMLRDIMIESAERSGLIGEYSKTKKNKQTGEIETFHAKSIAAALNPDYNRKQV